jgi:hypothetical protein
MTLVFLSMKTFADADNLDEEDRSMVEKNLRVKMDFEMHTV